jgi:hypothetical protein
MKYLMTVLICGFGSASYIAGVGQVIKGTYRPNTVSRVIWLLLAINSTAGVVMSHSSAASILLAVIFMIGNVAMCWVSFWKGCGSFGILEKICLALFVCSVGIWIWNPIPLVNLGIGLVGHFIGALPTFKNAVESRGSESTLFWSFFFIASVLTVIASAGSPWSTMIFPLYFVVFDGAMVGVSLLRE